MSEDRHLRAAASRASAILGVSRADLVLTDVSAKFSWVREGAILWARGPGFECAMFQVNGEGEPALLNGPDWLAALSRLHVASVGSMPSGLAIDDLARMVRQLGVEPRGLLASPALPERLAGSLDGWLKRDDPRHRQLFLDACTAPALRADGEHGWDLEFNFFNVKGGVEAWRVEGDHAVIHRAESKPLVPDHTFFWPMA